MLKFDFNIERMNQHADAKVVRFDFLISMYRDNESTNMEVFTGNLKIGGNNISWESR